MVGTAVDDAQAEYRLHALSRFSSLVTVMYENIKVDNGTDVFQIQKLIGHHSEFVAKLAERDSVKACADRKAGLDVQICSERQRGDLFLDVREDKTIKLFPQRRGTFVSKFTSTVGTATLTPKCSPQAGPQSQPSVLLYRMSRKVQELYACRSYVQLFPVEVDISISCQAA